MGGDGWLTGLHHTPCKVTSDAGAAAVPQRSWGLGSYINLLVLQSTYSRVQILRACRSEDDDVKLVVSFATAKIVRAAMSTAETR